MFLYIVFQKYYLFVAISWIYIVCFSNILNIQFAFFYF